MNNRQYKRAHHPILGPMLLDDVGVEVIRGLLGSVTAAVTGEGEVYINQLMGVKPLSRSWSRSAKLFSEAVRISGPWSARTVARIVISEWDLNAWKVPHSLDFLSWKTGDVESVFRKVAISVFDHHDVTLELSVQRPNLTNSFCSMGMRLGQP